jgi:hypothetical protein
MSALSIITRFGKTRTVKRAILPVVITRGITQPILRSDVDFFCVVVPMTGKKLDTLPEGMRDKDTIKIMSIEQLVTGDRETNTPPDQIIYNSKTYLITMTATLDADILDHYVYIAQVEQDAV